MPEPLMSRVFFFLTIVAILINMAGWYGLLRYYGVFTGKSTFMETDVSRKTGVPNLITFIIRIEFVYYILLLLYHFLSVRVLSSFWVLFMFLYHLFGLVGNEIQKRFQNYDGQSNAFNWKSAILLGTVAVLDLIEFYILITLSYRLYLIY